MKIVYAFIADFPPFKNAEMNFVSDWRCEFNGERLRVCYSKVLPKGFFSPDEQLCVSAVVGPNGAGKTSLVRFFWSLMYPSKKQDFILVVEAKGDLLAYYNLGDRELLVECSGYNVKTVKRYARNDDFQLEEFTKCFNVVYYSPHYSLSKPIHSFDNERFVNLSTTFLLNKAVDHMQGLESEQKSEQKREQESEQKRGQNSSVFLAEEFYRLARFYGLLKGNVSDVVGSGMKGITFLPDVQIVSFLANYYSEMNEREEYRIAEIRKGVMDEKARSLSDEEMIRIRNMLSFLCFDFKDAFMEIFKCFVAIFWQKNIFKETLFHENDYGCQLYNFCMGLTSSDSIGMGDVRKRVIGFLKSNKPGRIGALRYNDEDFNAVESENPVLAFFELLCTLTSQESTNGEYLLQMPWKDMFKELEYIKELYQHVTALGPFVELRFDPPMSSGQYTLHSFYARLYEHFFDIRKSVAGYDGSDFSREWAGHLESGWVVIMDEVEVTLHPEWQRTIISNLLTVFRNHFPGFNVHFIFMTHSPVILSDIPVGNAIFLKRCYEDEENHRGAYSKSVSVLKPQLGYTNTFAANIFDLYRNSFFMEKNGIVGMFAQEKLNTIMAKAKRIILGDKDQVKSKNEKMDKMEDGDWDTLALVGDPVANRYFSSIKAILKDI